jgi:hypothetical protein
MLDLERNGTMANKICMCGSGLPKEPTYDARGIFCFYSCNDCRDTKKSYFRLDVFTDPNYWHDEPIDEK